VASANQLLPWRRIATASVTALLLVLRLVAAHRPRRHRRPDNPCQWHDDV